MKTKGLTFQVPFNYSEHGQVSLTGHYGIRMPPNLLTDSQPGRDAREEWPGKPSRPGHPGLRVIIILIIIIMFLHMCIYIYMYIYIYIIYK